MRNLTEFGAFVEITDEIDGLIHVSDMSWTKRVKHPSEVLKKGDLVQARITNIDVDNQRVSLSIKEFLPNEWENFVANHHVGDTLDGRVVNVTDFGLFIDIYDGLEGLAHVSEIEVPAAPARGPLQGRRLRARPHPAHRGGGEEGRPLACAASSQPTERGDGRAARPRRPRRAARQAEVARQEARGCEERPSEARR